MHRVRRFRVDEVVELGLALLVVAGDAHDVAVVLGDQIGVLVDQRLPHPRGVVLSTQKTMVFWKRSPLSFRNSVTFSATSFVRSSSTRVRSKSLVL